MVSALEAILGRHWLTEHVGSTSVPGLLAKPVIDLALCMPDPTRLEEAAASFRQAGWTEPTALGDHWVTFLLVDGVRAGIAHVFTAQQWPDAHVRLFASWLRAHTEDRDSYADLKRSLVACDVWGSAYTEAKSAFVLDVVNRARVDRGLDPVAGPL